MQGAFDKVEILFVLTQLQQFSARRAVYGLDLDLVGKGFRTHVAEWRASKLFPGEDIQDRRAVGEDLVKGSKFFVLLDRNQLEHGLSDRNSSFVFKITVEEMVFFTEERRVIDGPWVRCGIFVEVLSPRTEPRASDNCIASNWRFNDTGAGLVANVDLGEGLLFVFALIFDLAALRLFLMELAATDRARFS